MTVSFFFTGRIFPLNGRNKLFTGKKLLLRWTGIISCLKLIILFLLLMFLGFFLICKPGFSQTSQIDSLKRLLLNVKGEEKVQVLAHLGGNYLRIDPNQTIYYASQALQLSDKIKFERGKAISYNILGTANGNLGDFKKSLDYFKKASVSFEKIGELKSLAVLSNNIGIIYKSLGDYSTSIKYYQKALNVFKKLNASDGMALTLGNIGIVYYKWGKYHEALENYFAAIEIYKNIGDQVKQASLYLNIGESYAKLGDIKLARENYEKSLDLSRIASDNKGLLVAYNMLGDLDKNSGKLKSATGYYMRSFDISNKIGDKPSMAYSSIKLGETFTDLKLYAKAYPYLQKGLQLADTTQAIDLIKDACFSLSEYYKSSGNYEKALEYYMRFTAIKDSVFNRESRKEITEMQTKYETEKKEQKIQILTKDKKIQQLKIVQQRNRLYYILSFVFLMILTAYLLFTRYKLKQKNFRTELERKNIEIEQRLLRTQMNPHFIFNSLNSINSFITSNNPATAQSFLTKFAKLMRYILDNSRKSVVPVEDEMNTLQLNLELEQLRFGNRFDFNIEVDELIDIENTYITPMLIQPFVENAIIHGVANKEGQGLIEVKLKIEGNAMHCVIQDNGIGREKAMELKNQSGIARHKSLGMQVTRERLELLKEKSVDVSLDFSDLRDPSGNASGTRIDLRIPYETE